MTLDYRQAQNLADALCLNPKFTHSYGAVEVFWVKRDMQNSSVIFNQRYQLLVAPERLLSHLTPHYTDYYVPIASIPASHRIYFIAKDSKPELTRGYFEGKKVGLLNDTRSWSRYQLPQVQFKNMGLSESLFQVLYFPSSRALYDALMDGDIDVAPFLQAGHQSPLPLSRALLLEENKNYHLFWFLQRDLEASLNRCELIKAIRKANLNAFPESQLVSEAPCSE